VTGQLGYDVMLELLKRGHTAFGSGSRDMKIFVTGVGGQLGHDVVNDAVGRGHEAIGSDIAAQYSGVQDGSAVVSAPYVQLDITDQAAVAATIETIKPDAIIHCAAWTAVDAAEDEENREKVHAINVDGTRYIAEAAKAVGAKMLYLSTDYVFDGKGERPWQPDDKNYAPLNYYGQTKLEGEKAVSSVLKNYFIVRIAWVFGLNGKNFIKTMINVGKTHDMVRVVDDQIGTPTYTLDLARLLVDMIETEKYGYYHATNEGGYISWYDFCCEFYNQYGLDTKVVPVTTAEYGLSKAARPFNSRLDKSKLLENGFQPLPDWKNAVRRYLAEAKL
jgi:dTDP-4-dehydrorhamnose reductase